MKTLRHISLLATLALVLVAAACSDNQTTAPPRSMGNLSLRAKSIGPSEIVLCVDVSDSTSADELQAMTAALQGCLSDPTLVPQDGNVSVGLIVYADTIASVVAPAVVVTATSLEEVLTPALTGLTSDRLVAGGGFDLSGALDQAGSLLAASSMSDRQVLIVGSGAADDPAAVQAACADLGQAGVMISALAVGADEDGEARLMGCAEATGGFFVAGQTDLGPLCVEALRYMLLVELDLEPKTVELDRGQQYTATATVFRGGDPQAYPLEGLDVSFAVVSGPNAGLTASAATDSAGQAAFSYMGDGGPGQDQVLATTEHPGTGTTVSDTVTVTWLNAPPVCDAGGPYELVVRADTVQVMLDGTGSSDADGDSLSFAWTVDCDDATIEGATTASPLVTLTGACLCVDQITAEVSVSDGFDTSVCQTVIQIEDRRPPVVQMVEGPLRIWPPNHKYKAFTPGMFILDARDACGNPIDPATAAVLEVRSDEPENELGDGATLDDIQVDCPNTVLLRAERAGGRNGRVYTIVYRVSDEDGDYVDVEAYVAVPHDNSTRQPLLDEGMGYTYTPDCDSRRQRAAAGW